MYCRQLCITKLQFQGESFLVRKLRKPCHGPASPLFCNNLAKYIIYRTKCNNERLSIAKHKRDTQFWLNAEKYNTFTECN